MAWLKKIGWEAILFQLPYLSVCFSIISRYLLFRSVLVNRSCLISFNLCQKVDWYIYVNKYVGINNLNFFWHII